LLNSNTSSTCPHNMVNFGLLTAEICWRIWDTPANFNRFRVFAASLHGTLVVGVSQALRRQPNFAALNRGRHLYSAGRPSHILVRVRLKRLITFCIVIAKIPKISYPWNVKLVANLRRHNFAYVTAIDKIFGRPTMVWCFGVDQSNETFLIVRV